MHRLPHRQRPANYATLAANSVLHTGISTGCAQCHGGATALTFYNNNDNPKSAVLSPPHIPAFTGTDCSNCHASTTYAVGTFGPMNMTQATHAGVGTTCNTCHEAGLSFYMGAASPGLQGRPADHTAGQQVAPNDCSLCHTTANWNTTVLPAGPHAESGQPSLQRLPHGGADQLRDARRQLGVAHRHHQQRMRAVPRLHDAAHLVQQLHAEGCGAHAVAYSDPGRNQLRLLSFLDHLCGRRLRADEHDPGARTRSSATTCTTCHEKGLSFYMGAASPALQGRPADHTAGQMVAPNDCSLCHTTANWNSTVMPAGHMPNPANQACSVCHTAAPTNYATLAANATSAHRHHQRLHHLSRRAECGRAGLLSQLHAEGCAALTGAHPDRQHAVRGLPRRSVSPRSAARR